MTDDALLEPHASPADEPEPVPAVPPRALWALIGLGAVNAAGAELVARLATGASPGGDVRGPVGEDVVVVLLGAVLVSLAVVRRGGRRSALVATGLTAAVGYASALRTTGGPLSVVALLQLATLGLVVWCLALSVRRSVAVDRLPAPVAHGLLAAGALLPVLVFVPLWAIALIGVWGREGLPLAALLDLGLVVPAGVLTAVLLVRRRRGGVELAVVLFVLEAALMAVFAAGAAAAPVLPGDWVPTAALGAVFLALAVGAVVAAGPRHHRPPEITADQVRLAA